MEYPHGHVSRHHHHSNNRRDDDNNNHHPIYPPPPPPPHVEFPNYPPPHQLYPPPQQPPHAEFQTYPPPPRHQVYPPPQVESPNYPYPPPPRQQSSHESGSHHEHGFHPHIPGFIESHFRRHDSEGSSNHSYGNGPDIGPGMGLGQLVNRPTHKILCKAGGEKYAIGVRDGKLVFTHPDHSDLTQHWYKDEKFSTRVKDKDGHPSFMLVNKGTGQAVKHSLSCHPVQLAPYRPDVLDESVLWTESRDLGSGFRTIRTVNNVQLVMDAWNADKDHGGLHEGTYVALYETWKGDNQNQQWKLVRH